MKISGRTGGVSIPVMTDKKTLRTDVKPVASGYESIVTDQKPIITD